MQQDEPSTELIERALAGAQTAIAELLSAHAYHLKARIRSRVSLNPSIDFTADDVLQETYIDVFKGISTFRPEYGVSFAAWLIRVADNRLAKMIRDRSRLKRGGGRWGLAIDDHAVFGLLADLGDDAKTGSERLARVEVVEAMAVAVAALPAKQREAVERYYLDQQTLSEIAQAMGRTKDAVRSLLHRAKESLGELMGGSSRWFYRK